MYIVFDKKWTKWELVEEKVRSWRIIHNPILGYGSEVLVETDVYRRFNKKTGIYQYKRVER